MLLQAIHYLADSWLKIRYSRIEKQLNFALDCQQNVFNQLLTRASHTAYGREYNFKEIRSYEDFARRVPLCTYETFFPYIERVLRGEPDCLWPGLPAWFAKSSGTTNDRSKYIPLTEESLFECHYTAGQDMVASYLHFRPNSKLFTGKGLVIGGSHQCSQLNAGIRVGDLSAALIENMSSFYSWFRTPDKSVSLLADWDQKLNLTLKQVAQENVTSIYGVPTWIVVLIKKLLADNHLENLNQIWPNLEVFFHGAVNFEPYRIPFQQFIPNPSMTYFETYNASEGFFAFQYNPDEPGMLLLTDYGIFYEFIPTSELENTDPKAIPLADVRLNENYSLVISTNGGLWRYQIGDTIRFTNLSPYKIEISGRTKLFINAFGEELMIDNAEKAVAVACQKTGARVLEYTVAPIYLQQETRGCHEWLIEFEILPDNMDVFVDQLDTTLRQLNSDYDAKRSLNLAMTPPQVRVMPNGIFYEWMRRRNKLGGQNKIPRLANFRKYATELIEIADSL